MRIIYLFLLGGVSLTGSAMAQMTPEQQMTLPASDPNSSQYHSVYEPAMAASQGNQMSAPPVRWTDRWGALADDGKGTAGIVADMPNKRAAQDAAVAECRKRGGGECRAVTAYYNQCLVVTSSANRTSYSQQASQELAEQEAMKECKEGQATSSDCHVYYSGCSLPIRTQ